MKKTLSVIVIAKNEEKNLPECLKRLKFAGEIILIDNNSTDRTHWVAKKFNARIYNYAGMDFSKMRILGARLGSFNWLLYIDADERVTAERAKEIKEKLIRPPQKAAPAAYSLIRRNFYFRRSWPAGENIIRLIKKDALIGWSGPVHESPRINGTVSRLKNPLLHYTHNDLFDMVEKTNLWSETEADLRYKKNHPEVVWWRFYRVMLTAFFNYFIRQNGFRAGAIGLVESLFQAFSIFITYAKLWERQISPKAKIA